MENRGKWLKIKTYTTSGTYETMIKSYICVIRDPEWEENECGPSKILEEMTTERLERRHKIVPVCRWHNHLCSKSQGIHEKIPKVMSLEVIHGQLTKSNHISIYTNDK